MATPKAAPPPAPNGERLGDLLLRERVLDEAALGEILLQQAASGKRLGAVLVDEGVISRDDLAAFLAQQMGLQRVDLGSCTPEPEAVGVLPEAVARSNQVIPLRLDGDTVEVVTADPSKDLAASLERSLKRPVRLVVAPPEQVQRAIDTSYRAVGAIGELVRSFESVAATRIGEIGALGEAASADAPVVKVVNLVITQALRDRASDVHIEPQSDHIRVRYRIDGALHEVVDLPKAVGPALISRLKILSGMNIVERRRPQDGQFAMEIDGRAVDIRVAIVATIQGEKCVLRVLDKSRSLYKLGDLGMPPDVHEPFAKLIRAPFGMVIAAGPTGSGKTTTLYAALGEVNDADRNITTVEDPVEYVFPSLNQIQIDEGAGLSFADGLKSILRQDPDVILVGEVRDAETARIAVQSSLTGHLVLSSLHATDAPAALHRLLDMGIESFLVASSVTAVVAQRLLRRVCTSCRAPYTSTDAERAFFNEHGGQPRKRLWAGKGCNFCAGTGYRDRIGVFEILRVTPEIRRLVVGWATQEELHRAGMAQGMRPLADEGVRLAAEGLTTIAEVIRGVYGGD